MKHWAATFLLLSATEQAYSSEALSVAIVPAQSTASGQIIATALNRPRPFYVVVSNSSKSPTSIWEYWNSWGYQSISFEVTLPDGKSLLLSRREEIFTRNFPSSFLVAPGEAQVFPIELDSHWENQKALFGNCDKQVKLRATFHIEPSNDATTHQVWSGSAQSKLYDFRLLCT
jgi:hypothetical protein